MPVSDGPLIGKHQIKKFYYPLSLAQTLINYSWVIDKFHYQV